MKKPKTIIVLIIILLIIIVLWQNREPQDIQLLFWTSHGLPKFVVYLIFYIFGVISALIGMLWRKI